MAFSRDWDRDVLETSMFLAGVKRVAHAAPETYTSAPWEALVSVSTRRLGYERVDGSAKELQRERAN